MKLSIKDKEMLKYKHGCEVPPQYTVPKRWEMK